MFRVYGTEFLSTESDTVSANERLNEGSSFGVLFTLTMVPSENDDHLWELSKENTAPLAIGRNVRHRPDNDDVMVTWEERIRPSERAAETNTLSSLDQDPLKHWLHYLQHLRRTLPNDTLQQFLLMERCARTFLSPAFLPRYRNDIRFLRVCILYADRTTQPHGLFQQLQKLKVGVGKALFWVTWAWVAESKGEYPLAEKIFNKGLRVAAEPKKFLEERWKQFLRRMSRMWLNNNTNNHQEEQQSDTRAVLNSLTMDSITLNHRAAVTYNQNAADHRNLQTRASSRRQARGIQVDSTVVERNSNDRKAPVAVAGFNIFQDANDSDWDAWEDKDCILGKQNSNDKHNHDGLTETIEPAGYRLTKEQERTKENKMKPERWNERGYGLVENHPIQENIQEQTAGTVNTEISSIVGIARTALSHGQTASIGDDRGVATAAFDVFVDEEFLPKKNDLHEEKYHSKADARSNGKEREDNRSLRQRIDGGMADRIRRDPLRYINNPNKLLLDQEKYDSHHRRTKSRDPLETDRLIIDDMSDNLESKGNLRRAPCSSDTTALKGFGSDNGENDKMQRSIKAGSFDGRIFENERFDTHHDNAPKGEIGRYDKKHMTYERSRSISDGIQNQSTVGYGKRYITNEKSGQNHFGAPSQDAGENDNRLYVVATGDLGGYDKKLIENDSSGQECCFEERRAAARYYNLISSESNFNLFKNDHDENKNEIINTSLMDVEESIEEIDMEQQHHDTIVTSLSTRKLKTSLRARSESREKRGVISATDTSIVNSRRVLFDVSTERSQSIIQLNNESSVNTSTVSSQLDGSFVTGAEETINTKFANAEISMMFCSPTNKNAFSVESPGKLLLASCSTSKRQNLIVYSNDVKNSELKGTRSMNTVSNFSSNENDDQNESISSKIIFRKDPRKDSVIESKNASKIAHERDRESEKDTVTDTFEKKKLSVRRVCPTRQCTSQSIRQDKKSNEQRNAPPEEPKINLQEEKEVDKGETSTLSALNDVLGGIGGCVETNALSKNSCDLCFEIYDDSLSNQRNNADCTVVSVSRRNDNENRNENLCKHSKGIQPVNENISGEDTVTISALNDVLGGMGHDFDTGAVSAEYNSLSFRIYSDSPANQNHCPDRSTLSLQGNCRSDVNLRNRSMLKQPADTKIVEGETATISALNEVLGNMKACINMDHLPVKSNGLSFRIFNDSTPKQTKGSECSSILISKENCNNDTMTSLCSKSKEKQPGNAEIIGEDTATSSALNDALGDTNVFFGKQSYQQKSDSSKFYLCKNPPSEQCTPFSPHTLPSNLALCDKELKQVFTPSGEDTASISDIGNILDDIQRCSISDINGYSRRPSKDVSMHLEKADKVEETSQTYRPNTAVISTKNTSVYTSPKRSEHTLKSVGFEIFSDENASFSIQKKRKVDESCCFGDISKIVDDDKVSLNFQMMNENDKAKKSFMASYENAINYTKNHKNDLESAMRMCMRVASKSNGDPHIFDYRKKPFPREFLRKTFPGGMKIDLLKGDTLTIINELGRGVFGVVLLCKMIHQDGRGNKHSGALKIQAPIGSLAHEYSILRMLEKRINFNCDRFYPFPQSQALYAFSEGGLFLMTAGSDSGMTLVDVVNTYNKSIGNVPELIAMYYTTRMLQQIEILHQEGKILHCDVKPDNWVLTLAHNQKTHADVDTIGGADLMLVDFGRATDLEKSSESNPVNRLYKGSEAAEDMECRAMRQGLPWGVDLDFFGLCASSYMLLFGMHIEVVQDKDTHRMRLKKQFRRYWQGDVWQNFFDTLLNYDVLLDEYCLHDLRQSFEACFCSNDRKREIATRLTQLYTHLPKKR